MRFGKILAWAGFAAVSLAGAGTGPPHGPEGGGPTGREPGRGGADGGPVHALVFSDPLADNWATWIACGNLGYERVRVISDEHFIEELRRQRWDFVGIDSPRDLIQQKALVAELLEDHVAAGGRLLVNYSRIDLWPELQELMDVRIVRPLARSLDVFATDPPHFMMLHFTRINVVFEPWPDWGHELDVGHFSFVVSLYSNGAGATVLSGSHRMVANGFNWDSYSSGGAIDLAERQIRYIIRCHPDFNDDGVLDFFDFLAFQNAFLEEHPRANLHFDAKFDFFDFLEFQKLFLMGCD